MDTAAIVKSFESDGHVIVPGLFCADEVADLEAGLAAYIRDVAPGQPAGIVYYEDDPPDVIKSVSSYVSVVR
jgi:hypothetical protein